MDRITLIVETAGGARRVALETSRMTLGRGESADVRIDDDGLSRVHASVYRDEGRLWIVDDGSTNGTTVNGRPIPPSGCALSAGDEIVLGETTRVRIEVKRATTRKLVGPVPESSAIPRAAVVAVVALVLVVTVAAGLGFIRRGDGDAPSARPTPPPVAVVTTAEPVTPPAEEPSGPKVATPAAEPAEPVAPSEPAELIYVEPSPTVGLGVTRLYSEMSEAERIDFIDRESRRISKMFGTRSYAFTDDVVRIIKTYLDGYASRGRSKSSKTWSEGLPALYGRATTYAPRVHRAFRSRGLSPVVGLYIVMIESEYRPCLTSPAGAKGMFQFMATTASGYGVDPSERCNVELMAPVCARYMSDMIAEFGSDSLSVALAIASYNRGEGGIRTDLHKALDTRNRERSFWTLVANEDRLPAGFQRENIRYVPKFFAAAIVGENPRAFGLDIRPLSTYVD